MTSSHIWSNTQGELLSLTNRNLQVQKEQTVNIDQISPQWTTLSLQSNSVLLYNKCSSRCNRCSKQLQRSNWLRSRNHLFQSVRGINIPATRSAIAPPPCQRVDFEIKPGMINLVQRKMFHGLSAEIPMEHIEAFEEICSFTRANGVPPDFIKCMFFPFSLADKASRWLKSLPTGSLTTWVTSTRKQKRLP